MKRFLLELALAITIAALGALAFAECRRWAKSVSAEKTPQGQMVADVTFQHLLDSTTGYWQSWTESRVHQDGSCLHIIQPKSRREYQFCGSSFVELK